MHLPGTNLHLERKRHLAPADDRCVQGLIHVRLRDGNVVLEAPWHLVPQRVDNAQYGIAVRHGVHQHANGNQVINLVKRLVLQHHLAVDAVKVLRAAVNRVVDMLLIQLGGQLVDDHADIFFPLRALLPDLLHQVLVPNRVDVAQGQVLQFLLDGVHAQPVRNRRIDVQRLARNRHAPLFLLEFQRPHVVQAVSQLNQHDADVLAHRQNHLAQRFRLCFFLVGEIEFVQLRHAIHQHGDFLAEFLPNGVQRDALAVLHRVVQKPGGNRRRVKGQFHQNAGDKARMGEIRLPAFAVLILVRLLCE